MPTGVHELFIDGVEDAIRSQLKAIRKGSDKAALFAQKVRPARSTEIYFPVDGASLTKKSKHEPDASFWHTDARYPGVIIEVAYSQKKKRLSRLAEDYLLDSNASVQVVVGLDIEYGKKGSRKATMSVWRTQVVSTANGDELRVVQEVADEAFRDDDGNPTDYEGLQLRLKDFAYEELALNEIGDEDLKVGISTRQLCEYLGAAETMVNRSESLGEHSVGPGIKKRKRSETPPEEINSNDEASKFRSRNGCLTCRARRVKCDETRPLCKACGKKNRPCQWKEPYTKFKDYRPDGPTSSRSAAGGTDNETDTKEDMMDVDGIDGVAGIDKRDEAVRANSSSEKGFSRNTAPKSRKNCRTDGASEDQKEATADAAYQRCVALLIEQLSEDAVSHDETLLCAVVVLRFYEQLNTLSSTGSDDEQHLTGYSAIIRSSRGNRYVDPSAPTFREAVFWVYVRQCLYNATINQQPPDIDFSLQLHPTPGEMRDAHPLARLRLETAWANQMTWNLACVVNFCFDGREPQNEKAHKMRRWQELWDLVQTWMHERPDTFNAVFEGLASGQGSFPRILFTADWHTVSFGFYHFAHIMLLRYKPGPKFAIRNVENLSDTDHQILSHARAICGASNSSPETVPLAITVCHTIFIWGPLVCNSGERDQVVQILSNFEKHHVWPTTWIINALKAEWGIPTSSNSPT
ncbi:uncharacterized protein ALTATR162_LOCUS12076 [Alternaria atra]|uniref:Zn(2)-C6 fungal-type domain-containing protein n=1 Tax=Alternaria atra TaxID=119953 RepID=A0A8J2IC72_9PLEO|nr:uncharacterized protein ALTATR162_LOCUS12076 [Alternaria atra]CAG5188981.1 unnamed protein product [Alternaria atra]